MNKNPDILIAACVVLFAACSSGTPAPTLPPAAAEGLFTEAQAVRGATLYGEQCASCHGEDMTGVADLFPALTGDTFVDATAKI